MHHVALAGEVDFDGWRAAARALALADVAPDAVRWTVGGTATPPPAPVRDGMTVSRRFVELARRAFAASDPARFDLLYRLLLRVRDDPRALDDHADPAVRAVDALIVAAQGLGDLEAEARGCTRCPLYAPATQTVFGEGPRAARLMLVGEQPGDQEDLAGRPFVGPAGRLLDRALAAAGIDRARCYVTNAVKHFKFVPRGGRRIHQKPDAGEIEACRWWLERERAAIRPPVTVALGATAALALLGRAVTITRTRGQALTLADGGEAWVTVHPSYLLRIDDHERAHAEFDRMVADLALARASLERIGSADVSACQGSPP